MRHLVQGLCHRRIILYGFTRRAAHQRNGRNGDSLIDNGNPEFPGYLLTCFNQVLCRLEYLAVYLVIQSFQVGVYAVQKADSQGDGAHIQIFLRYHLVGLRDLI